MGRSTGGASATGSRGAHTTMEVGSARTLEPTRIIPSRSSDPPAHLPHSRVETSGPLPAMPPWGIDAAVSDVRVDRRGRSCADYGKGLCQKRKWCRFDSAKGACEDKNESYLRG